MALKSRIGHSAGTGRSARRTPRGGVRDRPDGCGLHGGRAAQGARGLLRNAFAPDVPTMAEAGVAGYETTLWYGVVAPRGTPRDIRAAVADVLIAANALTDVQVQLAAMAPSRLACGVRPSRISSATRSSGRRPWWTLQGFRWSEGTLGRDLPPGRKLGHPLARSRKAKGLQ